MSDNEDKKSKKKKSFLPECLKDNNWLLSYPIYSISSQSFKELNNNTLILVAGGGGKSKTGVPNAFELFEINSSENNAKVKHILHKETKDQIIYCSSFHPSLPIFAISQANNCSIYSIEFKSNSIESINELFTFQSVGNDDDCVQNICIFSPNGKILATAGEDGKIKLWKISDDILQSSSISKSNEFTFKGGINDLQFSNDSNLIIYTTKQECKIIEIDNLKDIQCITPYKIPEKSSFRGCCFINNLTSSFLTVQGKPRFKSLICQWDTFNGKHIKKQSPSFNGPQTALTSCIDNNIQIFAIAYGEGDIELYKISKKGNILKVCKLKEIHSFIITSLSLTHDNNYILSGSVDRTFSITPVKQSSHSIVEWILFFILLYIIIMISLFMWFIGIYPALELINNL